MSSYLLSQTRLTNFGARVGFVVTVAGVLAAIATNISYWNWYGFPTVYTSAYMFIQVVGFLCVGLVAAVGAEETDVRSRLRSRRNFAGRHSSLGWSRAPHELSLGEGFIRDGPSSARKMPDPYGRVHHSASLRRFVVLRLTRVNDEADPTRDEQ